ncbi:MAG: hypothetical protein Q9167_005303 [Letrouitia subvulpina]
MNATAVVPSPTGYYVFQSNLRGRPRWKDEADNLLRKIPSAEQWLNAWKKYGDGNIVDALTQGLAPDSEVQAVSLITSAPVCNNENTNDFLLSRLSSYARAIKSCPLHLAWYRDQATFRELIFVSFCEVLVKSGTHMKAVNDIMRIYVTDSSWRNLTRLRKGALWVNKLIHTLQDRGWRHRATLVFILCNAPHGKDIAQYARFASSFDESLEYFEKELTKLQYTENLEVVRGWRSFTMLALVQRLVDHRIR